MFEMTVGLLCFFLVAAIWRYLASQAERTAISEMSDACIKAYAMWDDAGIPDNIYAEEADRRKKTSKEIKCNR